MDTKKWTTQIDIITNDFVQSFSSLSHEQLNWKPSPQTWSIAQNIDHLIVINTTYYPTFHSIRTGSYQLPFIAKFDFMVSFLGKTILKASDPERKKKMKTFPLWEPTKSEVAADILAKFEKHQEELKQIIESSSDLLDRGTIISSPANRNIVYKLETAFDIIVTHELRHLNQAKEVSVHSS